MSNSTIEFIKNRTKFSTKVRTMIVITITILSILFKLLPGGLDIMSYIYYLISFIVNSKYGLELQATGETFIIFLELVLFNKFFNINLSKITNFTRAHQFKINNEFLGIIRDKTGLLKMQKELKKTLYGKKNKITGLYTFETEHKELLKKQFPPDKNQEIPKRIKSIINSNIANADNYEKKIKEKENNSQNEHMTMSAKNFINKSTLIRKSTHFRNLKEIELLKEIYRENQLKLKESNDNYPIRSVKISQIKTNAEISANNQQNARNYARSLDGTSAGTSSRTSSGTSSRTSSGTSSGISSRTSAGTSSRTSSGTSAGISSRTLSGTSSGTSSGRSYISSSGNINLK